jgi:hypothetical protein
MHISSNAAIEGGRVLYAIGRLEAASAWHPAHGSPLQENCDYQNDGVIRIDESGVTLKRVVATGIAVKLSCAA